MASKFSKQNEQKIDELIQQLIPTLTGFRQGQENFQIAHRFATSNLKYHTFLDPDKISVGRKLEGLYTKISILCRPELSDYLKKLVDAFLRKTVSNTYPDMHYRILECLVGLSGNIVEYNQNRQMPETSQILEILQDNALDKELEQERQQIMQEWGRFETSSDEENSEISEEEQQEKKLTQGSAKKEIFIEDKPVILKTQESDLYDNYLFHISNPKKRSLSQVMDKTQQYVQIDKFSMYRPEFQNQAAQLHISRQQELYLMRKYDFFLKKSLIQFNEIDVVTSICYALLQKETKVFKIKYEFTELDQKQQISKLLIPELKSINQGIFYLDLDITFTHLSVQGLHGQIQKYLDFINIVHGLKCITNYQLQNYGVAAIQHKDQNNKMIDEDQRNSDKDYLRGFYRETQIKEAFWISLDNTLKRLDQKIVEIMKQLVYHTGQYSFQSIFKDPRQKEQYFRHPVTLLSLEQKLKNDFQLFFEVLNTCLKLQHDNQTQQVKSIFSSPTLSLLLEKCAQHKLQNSKFLKIYLQFFCDSLNPFVNMIDQLLDFHNYPSSYRWEADANIPSFLKNCITQLQAIGTAFSIYQKILTESITKLKPEQQLDKINFRATVMQRVRDYFKVDIKPSERQRIHYIELSDLQFDNNLPETRDNSDQKIQEEIDYGPYQIYKNEASFISSDFSIYRKPIDQAIFQVEMDHQDIQLSALLENLNENGQLIFINILTSSIEDIIKSAHDTIQRKLLSIIYDNLNFMDVLKFSRVLYFFERYDVMCILVQKLADVSTTSLKLRGLQQQLKELILENQVAKSSLADNFQFSLEQSVIFMNSDQPQVNSKNFFIKLTLQHPLDLIIDDNSSLLYNRIMQELIFFKSSKHNLQQIHHTLKKRVHQIQNKKKLLRINLGDDSDEDQSPISNHFTMIDEKEQKHKNAQLKKSHALWFKMCLFAKEIYNFLVAYEHFLFESIIDVQTQNFLEKLKKQKDLNSIIQLHSDYTKSIADRMFLNKKVLKNKSIKSHQILDTINQILFCAQTFHHYVERVSALDILDSITIRIETDRADQDFDKMIENYRKKLQTLIILFDKNEPKAYATEIIEAIFKSNYNKFY